MSLYACFCEVDRDCTPVSQWCEPCQERHQAEAEDHEYPAPNGGPESVDHFHMSRQEAMDSGRIYWG